MADKFDIIAKIVGKTEGQTQSDKPKETIKLELEESDGKKFTWTSFHVSDFQTLKIGSVHRFTVSRPPNKDTAFNAYRNLEAYVGPAEIPASGEMTSLGQGVPSTTGGGGGGPGGNRGPSPVDRYAERISIESQGSVGTILRLIESGMTLEEAEEALPKVLELALKVEDHHAGAPIRRPAPAAVVANTPAGSPPSTNGATPKPKADVDGIQNVENLGQFLTLCRKKYPAHKDTLRKDIEVALHMVLDDITDYNDAWAQLGVHWEDSQAPAETT